jgi:hypothetical protein
MDRHACLTPLRQLRLQLRDLLLLLLLIIGIAFRPAV